MRPNKIKVFLEGLSRLQKNQSDVTFQIQSKNENAYEFKLSFLFHKYFQKHHPSINVNQISQQFQQYLTLPPEILGKKSSKIIFSKSHRFCIKQITNNDVIKIEQILNDLQIFKQDLSCCLIDIYGIFLVEHSIKGVKISDFYMIMPNIRGTLDYNIRSFDLKGYTQSRQISEQDFQDFQFGKDLNFLKSQEITIIHNQLTQKQRKQWIQNIKSNLNFLKERNIIDYSLLLSFVKSSQESPSGNKDDNKEQNTRNQIKLNNGVTIKWAIIDYFQQYNDKKKIQNKFKSLFKKQISSVEPQVYAQRLVSFLMKHLCQN